MKLSNLAAKFIFKSNIGSCSWQLQLLDSSNFMIFEKIFSFFNFQGSTAAWLPAVECNGVVRKALGGKDPGSPLSRPRNPEPVVGGRAT